MGKNFGNKNNAAKQSGYRGPKQQTNFKAKFKPPGKHQSGGGGGFNKSGGGGGGFNKGKRSGDFNSSGGGQGFNKNKAMNQSGNFGQQKNFKPNFKSPGKFQSGGQGFNKNKPAGNFKSPSPGGKFNKAGGGPNSNFKSPGKKQSAGGDNFNKNKKGAKAQKEKLKFDADSSDEEEDEEIDDEELGDLSEEDMMGSDDEDEMESEEEEESNDAITSPAKSKQNAETLKSKLAEMKSSPVKVETKTSPVKAKVEAKTLPTAKVEEQVKNKSAKNAKGTELAKEKLKFDEDSSDEEDEEMMGSDDEDEMESEEEEESDDSVTSPAKVSKQMETTKRKLAEMKPTNVKVEAKTSPVKAAKVEAKTAPTVKVGEIKNKSAKDTKVLAKEKLHFDEDSSDEEDEEVGDEEMDFSDEEMMGSDDEDEMESEEEEENDDAMTSPAKSNKLNAETLKRKLTEMKTPPTPQSAVKKARLEGGEERSVKVEEKVEEKPAKKADKKEAKKEKKVEQKEVQNIPKLSDEQVKAIIAEEDRRREERDKRTLFTRCETFKLMKESDIKSLHPDIVSIRHNHGMSWLVFPSEASAIKAYSVLSKKTELDGKEFFVDRSGANSKNQANAKGKFDSKAQRPINPLELVLVHLPKSTTEEQLRVIFPTATQIDIPAKEKKPGKKPFSFGGRSIAFIKFGNVADAKKAFESHGNQAMLKIGGELIDMYYRRH